MGGCVSEERKEINMELITVFLLLGPGILMWKLEGDCELATKESIIRMVLKLIFYNFIILMLSYFVLTLIYGYMAVNLSDVYVEGVGNSIFNISFVWKFGMMSCAFAVILGVGARLWNKRLEKRSGK